MSRSPEDTLAVYGGAGPSTAETDSVRCAAARLACGADDLRAASVRCLEVGGDLAPPGIGGPGWPGASPGTVELVGGPAADSLVRDAARRLGERADLLDLLAWRLLRAAGLYEEAETTAERLVGTLLAVGTSGAGAALGGLGWAGLAGAGALAAVEGAGRLGGVAATGGAVVPVAGAAAAAATRGLAPYSDEVFSGLGGGVALTQPGLADGRPGVAGGAGALAHAVREVPVLGNDDPGVRLTRLGPGDFASGIVPAWSGTGARSVSEALTRIDDLYPGPGGAPEATLAVQKVTAEEGGVSWTVLVPGTQSALPAGHPWDGRTDLELMAGQPDGATAAIERALADSGVGPDEPVTLVGHSLGGIAAAALVSRAGFAARYRVGGLVTAGAPTGLITTPPGVPVLHLETPEELVTSTDGRSGAENPRTRDRVTVVRSLRDSTDPDDSAASGSLPTAHTVATHVRTLDLALGSHDPRVAEVADRIGARLAGAMVTTAYYRVERAGP